MSLGGLGSESAFSSTANMWFGRYAAPVCRSGQTPTLAVQEWTASNPELRAAPARQPSVGSGGAPGGTAGSSVLDIEECRGVRLLCDYDRSDRDTLTLVRRYLAEMLACAAPTVAFGVRPLRGAGLTWSRESAEPVARRNACMRHAFNRSVMQLSVGSMPGHSVGRRLRKAKEETEGLGTISSGTAGTPWRRLRPDLLRSLLELSLYHNASRFECWTGLRRRYRARKASR
jgi:hypothetical protein